MPIPDFLKSLTEILLKSLKKNQKRQQRWSSLGRERSFKLLNLKIVSAEL
jgi:hypothetical protein